MRLRASRLSPDARRAQLVDCALRVFARRGLARGGHAEVAREAGVAVPTVFAYFGTRADLVLQALDRVVRYYTDMVERHCRPENPAPRALFDFAIDFAASVDRDPDVATVLLDWSTAVRSELWPRFLAFHRDMAARMEATIRRGREEGTIARDVDASDAALILIGSAHLVVQMKFSHTAPERVHRFLLALFRAAIGPAAVAAALA
jgi:TetR/AcrR family transcriptional regulator, hemagglutinin/protease regulatory protein